MRELGPKQSGNTLYHFTIKSSGPSRSNINVELRCYKYIPLIIKPLLLYILKPEAIDASEMYTSNYLLGHY